MKTIIINNKEIEISDESYEDLRKQLCYKFPTCWEELEYIKKGYYVDINSTSNLPTSNLFPIKVIHDVHTIKQNKYIFKNKKEAFSSLAKSQLSHLMDAYNDGWVPDWDNISQIKYAIVRIDKSIKILNHDRYYAYLVFKTEEIANRFLRNFEDLIKQYYEI